MKKGMSEIARCKGPFFPRMLAVAGVLLFLITGCGDRSRQLYPVTGVVVWTDGQPATELADGVVSIRVEAPGTADGRTTAQGQIQADGTWTLRTPGVGQGVSVGKYQAIVMPQKNISPLAPLPAPIINPRYEEFDTSGLKVIVEPNENHVTLMVDRARRK